MNCIGGLKKSLNSDDKTMLLVSLKSVEKDFSELERILMSSISFMDRVDTAGILRKKTAEDLGIVGLAARASGIPLDLRKVFPEKDDVVRFQAAKEEKGDVLARLKIRLFEFKESVRLIREFSCKIKSEKGDYTADFTPKEGFALGYVESWRGPVLFWIKLNSHGLIERCKITDPSFHNWQGLSFAVLGNIIPDFPLCNKSFDLTYSGNDL
jgi:Ni,Fe-hydrogenase III large subunit